MKIEMLGCESGCDDMDVMTDGGEEEGGKILDSSGNVAVVEKNDLPEKMVPLSSLEDERGKRQTAEGNVNALTDHIRHLQSVAVSEKVPNVDPLSKLDPDNVITVREVQDMMTSLNKSWEQKVSGSNAVNAGVLAELQVKADHHDYNNVIKTNLVNVLNEKPELKAAISSAPEEHRPLLAYSIGIMDSEYQKQKTGDTHKTIADRLRANTERPGSINAVSSSADTTDLAKLIATESSELFEKRVAAVKAKGSN